MKVAILGTGAVAIDLAKGFVSRGHSVVFGTRDAQGERAVKAVAAVPGSSAAPYDQAAVQGEIAVLATPWNGTQNAVLLSTQAALKGKLLIDVTNPLDFSTGKPQMALGFPNSAGASVQAWLPDTKVVKAFNTIGSHLFVNPKFNDHQPAMFITGNDAQAKQQVTEIATAFGWNGTTDMGDISKSYLLETLAMLWIEYGVTRNHWMHGISLLNGKQEA
jgi:8-hydroxy-5-deazaflavin:NADPH oxidoreductase